MPTLFQINSFCNTGSTGRIAEALGQTVMKHGWQSFIAYGRTANPSQSYTYKIGNKWNMMWHGLQTRLFDKQGLASRRATKELIKVIRSAEPDIIHLHNLHGYYLNYPLLFKFLRDYGRPVVWTLHDCWSFTGHCPHFEFAKCDKWKDRCGSCPTKHDYPASLWKDRSTENFQDKKAAFTQLDNLTLVPVSDWLATYLKMSFFNKYPIHRIHNGIDVSMFNVKNKRKEIHARYKIPDENHLIIGVAGIWDKRKGLADFIKLRKALPLKYSIMLVGLSRKQIGKLPNGIVGIRRTESVEELAEIYSAADVLFNPTWEDTFPTINLEAMACGTPVVAYRTGGCVEQIVEGTGYIAEQGNIEDAQNHIVKLCNSDNSDSACCRDWIVNNFRQEDRYDEYFKLYESLLQKPQSLLP